MKQIGYFISGLLIGSAVLFVMRGIQFNKESKQKK